MARPRVETKRIHRDFGEGAGRHPARFRTGPESGLDPRPGTRQPANPGVSLPPC